jgi:hypothetical protein
MCKKFPPRFQNSPKGLVEMGYIPPAFLASEEFVGGIFPLKIPPTLKYSTIWRNFVCGGKRFHQKIPLKKFLTLNINSLIVVIVKSGHGRPKKLGLSTVALFLEFLTECFGAQEVDIFFFE